MNSGTDTLHRLARIAAIGFYRWNESDHTYHDVSDSYAALHGLSRNDFLAGYTGREDDIRRWIHPDDVDAYLANDAAVTADPRPWSLTYRMVDIHGAVKWITETAEPSFRGDGTLDGWIGVCRDVTGEHETQDALRHEAEEAEKSRDAAERLSEQSRAQLAEAVESLSEAFVLYDQNERLVLCNDHYRSFFPCSAAAVKPGARLEDILRNAVAHGDFPEAAGREDAFVAERLSVFRDAPSTLEEHLSDGRWVRTDARRTSDGSTIGFKTDITDLKTALHRAEAANTAKSSFLASMSHEIRTPMTAILGLSDFLLDGPLGTRERDLARKIKGAAESLLHILNDALDLSKIEAGRMDLSIGTFDVRPLIVETVAWFEAKAEARQLTIAADIDAQTPLWVRADKARLRQVLINLIGNAVKFTLDGSITVRAARDGDAVRIDVVDTGVGIDPRDLKRVFDAYEQADGGGAQPETGTGLGLTISKRLIEMMQGQISLTSEPGRGSTFSFTTPGGTALEGARDADAEAAGDTPESEGSDRASRHVLVVDDDELSRMVVTALLNKFGHTYDEATTGAEAVARASARPYDIILMDIRMPDFNGDEAARRIRDAARDNADTPIVALTADIVEEQLSVYADAGMARTVAKPINPRDLERAIADLTGGSAPFDKRPSTGAARLRA
jgi:signal transduction histidine kinase/ActR/RegA family two-component response regulator